MIERPGGNDVEIDPVAGLADLVFQRSRGADQDGADDERVDRDDPVAEGVVGASLDGSAQVSITRGRPGGG